MLKRSSIYRLFPFIIAIYPILALSSNNPGYVNFNSILRSLILAILVTIIGIVLFSLLTKNRDKGNLLTSLVLLIFFSYGHIYVYMINVFGKEFRHLYLILGFMLIGGVLTWLFLKARAISATITSALFYASLVLIFLTSAPILTNAIKGEIARNDGIQTVSKSTELDNFQKPDIYLIILDSYTREDVLEKYYHFDNSPFLNKLRDLGFYVAGCSQSNYPTTRFSLSSLFMSNYLPTVSPQGHLPPLMDSQLIRKLRSLGYSLYTFENRSEAQFDLGEDRAFTRNDQKFGLNLLISGLNEFESMFLETSALRILLDMPQLAPGFDLSRAKYYEHYMQVKYTLTELPKIPALDSPKFVVVHLLVPHEPYIHSPAGEYSYTGNQVKGYAANIGFINNEIPSILTKIINASKIPPVIVLQGDHGAHLSPTRPEIRLAILNAYYVKDETKKLLYPAITPVNSFRVILDSYFGTKLGTLEDRSFFAYSQKEMVDENLFKNQCVP